MAYSVNSNAFVTMFGDEVTHLSQQMSSQLQGAVRTVRGVQGHTYNFPVLGKGGVVKNKTAIQDIESMHSIADTTSLTSGSWVGDTDVTMAHTNVSATINTYSTGEYIDDFDSLKTNIDLRSAYAESISAAMNRAYDSEIIGALDAANTGATLAGELGSKSLDKANVALISKTLSSKDVPLTDRYLLTNPTGLESLLADSTVVGAANGVIADQALATGFIPNFLGFNVIISNLITNSFAFHKNAVGCAIGKDITTLVNYVPHKLSTLVAAEFSAGCKVIDNNGVVSFTAA